MIHENTFQLACKTRVCARAVSYCVCIISLYHNQWCIYSYHFQLESIVHRQLVSAGTIIPLLQILKFLLLGILLQKYM